MKNWIALLIISVAFGARAESATTTSLAGSWRFQLDRADAGINEQWFANRLNGTIRLPGSLSEQGIGDDVSTNTPWTGSIVDRSWFTAPEYAKYRQPGNIKIPFWLQPEKYYAGAAWFQRDIEIPKDWTGKRMVLFLERPIGKRARGWTVELSAQTPAFRRRTNMTWAGSRPASTSSPCAWTTGGSWTLARIPTPSAITPRATGTASLEESSCAQRRRSGLKTCRLIHMWPRSR